MCSGLDRKLGEDNTAETPAGRKRNNQNQNTVCVQNHVSRLDLNHLNHLDLNLVSHLDLNLGSRLYLNHVYLFGPEPPDPFGPEPQP
ncbi:hypothetical protein GBF38_021138 [Nibea albiflora]|uniref:Uncharacterized protein n=1 Tax=Nibea albiflora TaxID=240163 RepID=A0ACB7EXY5_NIBAL|nr:hypothetical protein GBF38_021138 [Nibea albiflora]